MSITFYAPSAPEQIVESYTCDCVEWPNNPACKADPDCPLCNGTGVWSYTEHEGSMNVANSNGLAILRMVGVPEDYCGEISYEKLPELRRGILKALNMKTRRASEEREGYELKPGHAGVQVVNEDGISRIQRMGPAVHYQGRSDLALVKYLERLQNLCEIAEKHNSGIVWG